MSVINIEIEIDEDDLPSYTQEILEKSIALKAVKGTLLGSNFILAISRVGSYRIESGFIRRVQ